MVSSHITTMTSVPTLSEPLSPQGACLYFLHVPGNEDFQEAQYTTLGQVAMGCLWLLFMSVSWAAPLSPPVQQVEQAHFLGTPEQSGLNFGVTGQREECVVTGPDHQGRKAQLPALSGCAPFY